MQPRTCDSSTRPSIAWIALVCLVGNTCIALVLWLAVPAIGKFGLFSSFVFSQCIGITITTLSVFAGRFADKRALNSPLKFALMVPVVLVGASIGLTLGHWIMGTPEPIQSSRATEKLLPIIVTVVVATVLFYWFYTSQEKVADLKLAASEQERRADNARHAMLRAQLNPHMLFNTLANLRALITTDQDKALQMLDRLDAFLRETLDGSVGDGVQSLDKEFGIIENYLSLMQIRLADRLSFKLDLPSDLKTIQVPSLLLQPIVENSVKHGIEPLTRGGTIDVQAQREGAFVSLRVRDNGSGFSDQPRTGFGLTNLRERVTTMYGEQATLTVADANPGCIVTVTFPDQLAQQ
jgi:signal transduction histidine kinase